MDAWTRSSDNALCGIERRERKDRKVFPASNPTSCNIDGEHGREGDRAAGERSSSWPVVMR